MGEERMGYFRKRSLAHATSENAAVDFELSAMGWEGLAVRARMSMYMRDRVMEVAMLERPY